MVENRMVVMVNRAGAVNKEEMFWGYMLGEEV